MVIDSGLEVQRCCREYAFPIMQISIWTRDYVTSLPLKINNTKHKLFTYRIFKMSGNAIDPNGKCSIRAGMNEQQCQELASRKGCPQVTWIGKGCIKGDQQGGCKLVSSLKTCPSITVS